MVAFRLLIPFKVTYIWQSWNAFVRLCRLAFRFTCTNAFVRVVILVEMTGSYIVERDDHCTLEEKEIASR